MTMALSTRARLAIGMPNKVPNVVLEIDGVSTIYGTLLVKKYAQIGDPDLEIGDPETDSNAFYIGGLDNISDQDNAISMADTTNSIKQMLQIDLGKGGSVTTLSVALLDGGGKITKLITPGEVVTDILQRRCKVYLGFDNAAYPDDYIVIFRGVVSDVTSDAGKVTLTLNHPDDKKQGSIFKNVKPKLNGAINNSVTTITVTAVADILKKVTGPDGTYDSSFLSYVLIDDEIIYFTGISGSQLTGCTRGQLGTSAAAHDDAADVSTFYRLTGNCVDLALKLLASTGDGSNYLEGVAADAFEDIDGTPIANAVYFKNVKVTDKYNVAIGDWITITLATNGANNVALKQISDIIDTAGGGQYLVIDGVTFVSESTTSALCAFRSQYDTLPDGLGLINDEIDIDEHQRLQDLFLSDFTLDFYLKDTIDDTRKFLEQEVYSPVAAFSLPKKSRCSVGYHIGPIPGQSVKTFDDTNIKEPGKMRIMRSTNRNFYNEIIYQFDEDVLTTKFFSGVITISELSKAQIPGLNKTLTIVSKGLRSLNNGVNVATSQSNRRLTRYQYGAETLSFGAMFDAGFDVEIGDIIWVDGSNLKLPDIKTGLKGMAGRYFFVQNKTMNFKTGDIQFDCIDTHFAGTGRYGLISPSSEIAMYISTTQFEIGQSFSGKYGSAEHKKWTNLIGATVRVRMADFSLSAEVTLMDATTNTITVSPALPWLPSIGMIMELTTYDNQALDSAKLVYVHMRDSAFADGKNQFVML